MGSPALRIRLLGELDLRSDGASLPPLDSARAASLLAFLLLHRDAPQSRQRLAFLLWPDSSEPQARTNLRHVLHNLRRALPDLDQFIEVTSRTLQWRPDAPFWLDVAAFEESLARAEGHNDDGAIAALRDAVDIYAGDLLEGCYDEWILGERDRLRQRYLAALERLALLLEARGDYSQAIVYAERLLRHDPLHEETYRLLMQLHAARGDRARALRVYHAAAATLERELGVEPSAPTRDAYEALLRLEPEPADARRQGGRVGRAPLVGRVAESKRLEALWRATERGRAQFVLVTGEPGIGKTRLIEEFRSWCAHRGALTAEAHSYRAEGALAYGPVVAWLRSDALKPRLDRLDRPRLSELARVLPELLSEVPDLPHPEPLLESDQRRRLFDALAGAILVTGAPLLLVADDLHWSDQETLQFLHYLMRVEPDVRLLVAATARHEEIDEHHPLGTLLTSLRRLDCLTEIELGRLTREETAILVERLAGRPLSDVDADRFYGETEGNPLFVVEALRAGWGRGEAGGGWMSPKVQAAIESRLTQLSPPARNLVDVAATIGRAFTADVLASASGVDEVTLVRGLDELWRRRIAREHGADGYDFSHDKIREVAYLALSPARRRQHHLRVAQALERVHSRDPAAVSAQIAAHYDQAGAVDQAIAAYRRAAELARQLYANAESLRLLGRALDLLLTRAETTERAERELALITAMQAPLAMVDGYGSSRLSEVQQRGLSLARALAVAPPPPLLRSVALTRLSRSEFDEARRYGEQLRALAEETADDVLLVEAGYILGIAAFWQGAFQAARQHFETSVDRYRPEHRAVHILWYGLDPKVTCLGRLGNTLWYLGLPESAARARDAALALAEEVGHGTSRGTALVFAAILAIEMRDLDQVRAYTRHMAATLAEDESRQARTSTEALGGYVDVLDGQDRAGIARIQRALENAGSIDHAPGMRAVAARLLVDACAVAGDVRTGLRAAEQALALGGTARIWAAEIRRRRAEFLAELGAPPGDVEAEFARALRVACGQGALMLELRAAASLVRYRRAAGDGAAIGGAQEQLAAIIDRLPEGRNAPEVREATALLVAV